MEMNTHIVNNIIVKGIDGQIYIPFILTLLLIT